MDFQLTTDGVHSQLTTTDGVHISAALHYKSAAGPAALSIAVGDGHSELSTAEARSIGELLVFGADAIEGAA